MKKVLILALAIVMSASLAFAQYGGQVSLYSDQAYSNCNLTEALFVSNTVYVVHDMAASGNTAQFKVVNNWPGPIAGAISWGTNLTLGDVYTGITVTYVGCKALPYLLGTMGFIPIAATPPCTATLQVVADPAVASGSVEVVDCSSNVLLATGGLLTINGNPTDCPCVQEIATEQSNWSRIKNLYR